ncbi:MAG: metalloregulator ArsR/SmtB family transcription factor [Actinobacteria bacterium]|nr:metalloregulator ArsR/SmtB family transcription factor [Actinomycetota bacterium]
MTEHTRDHTPAPGRQPQAACCPLPAGVSPLPAADGLGADEAVRLAAAARALSDPIRLRMLAQMTAALCCRGPAAAGGSAGAEPAGVCVCELQGLYGLAQSKVSYHLKVLREAGLVHETRRGKWSFYAVDEAAARAALTELGGLLGL